MTPRSVGRENSRASATENSTMSATPARSAFAREISTALGSMSEPKMRYSPLYSLARAASRSARQITAGRLRHFSAAKPRFMLGARPFAASAASMAIVPLPQKGSQNSPRPR